MARFQSTIDIFTLSDEQRAQLQPGQWVTAGPDDFGDGRNRGRYFGKSANGNDICAWIGNAKGRYRSYMASIAAYGRSARAV